LAEHLDGSTPLEERDRILAQLAAGKIDVVVNCMVLVEGWDEPSVSCLVLARPTKSLGLYRQMIGRSLRTWPGKTDALILDHSGATFEHGFVEDPIEWTLFEDCRAENRIHKARGTSHAPSLTTCPECLAVRFEGRPCPVCHWRPTPKPKPVDVIDGELGWVARNRNSQANIYSPEEKLRFHRQLLWIAREKGRKPGAAAYQYKEKFGAWPDSPPWAPPEPEPPEPAVRAWAKSRDIAFAKAMAKQREAR
jgi:superfamily II DNA or RNA helicase